MKKTVLREYARLIVKKGVNVQKGQEVLIYADLDQPEFVALRLRLPLDSPPKKRGSANILPLPASEKPFPKIGGIGRIVPKAAGSADWTAGKKATKPGPPHRHKVAVPPARLPALSVHPAAPAPWRQSTKAPAVFLSWSSPRRNVCKFRFPDS